MCEEMIWMSPKNPKKAETLRIDVVPATSMGEGE
jgi:hypothetical protein